MYVSRGVGPVEYGQWGWLPRPGTLEVTRRRALLGVLQAQARDVLPRRIRRALCAGGTPRGREADHVGRSTSSGSSPATRERKTPSCRAAMLSLRRQPAIQVAVAQARFAPTASFASRPKPG